jgi:peptidoglycan/LPS O-acetylase OafA/YrhL
VKPDQIPSLTGLRFVAVMSVVVAHGRQLLAVPNAVIDLDLWLTSGAQLGMTLFFVLSGFVIHYNYDELITKTPLAGFATFIWARFARLYPLFFAVILIEIFTGTESTNFLSGQADSFDQLVRALPYYFTLTQSWFYSLGKATSLVYVMQRAGPPTWSISTEWFFYMAYPVCMLALIRLRSPKTIMMGAVVFCVAWTWFALNLSEHSAGIEAWAISHFGPLAHTAGNQHAFLLWLPYFSPYVRIGEFLLGALTAQFYLATAATPQSRIEKLFGSILTLVAAASFPTILFLTYSPTHSIAFFHLLERNFGLAPSAAVLLFCAARYKTILARTLSTPLIVRLGDASYSIYLLHVLVFALIGGNALLDMGDYASPWLSVAMLAARWTVATGLLFVLAIGSYRTIEIPARRFLRSMPERFYMPAVVMGGVVTIMVLIIGPRMRVPDAKKIGIEVLSATYGQNCGAHIDNVRDLLASSCDGQQQCDYKVLIPPTGDPGPGCQIVYCDVSMSARPKCEASRASAGSLPSDFAAILLTCASLRP